MTIVPEQCLAARGMLRWSQEDLCRRARVARGTVVDFENGAKTPHHRTLAAIVQAFNAAGIEFENGDAPCVRLRRVTATQGNGERAPASAATPRPGKPKRQGGEAGIEGAIAAAAGGA